MRRLQKRYLHVNLFHSCKCLHRVLHIQSASKSISARCLNKCSHFVISYGVRERACYSLLQCSVVWVCYGGWVGGSGGPLLGGKQEGMEVLDAKLLLF